MQLFLTTPLFVYAIWLNRKLGVRFLILTAIFSTVLRFWVSWQNNLSCMVHFGITCVLNTAYQLLFSKIKILF